MIDHSARKWVSILIVLIPVGVLIYALFNQTQALPKPKAVKGEIDLTHWKFDADGSVPLNGEWKFFWNTLLIDESGQEPAYMPVPGIWNGCSVNNTDIPAAGFATYTLKVRLPEANRMYAFNLLTVSNAYQLYVDGELISANGRVGTNETDSDPAYDPRVVPFMATNDAVTLTMQISNFHHCI